MLFIGLPARNYFAPYQDLFFDRSATDNTEFGNNYVSLWLESYSHRVLPRPCHSHNDYWRPYPLFSALDVGCTGVEADVWLSKDGTDLLVGHDRASLAPDKTLRSMYLDPLLELLDRRNQAGPWANSTATYNSARGVFEMEPHAKVVLMIDVKEKPAAVWPLVIEQLEPFRRRQYLARYEMVYPSPGLLDRQTLWPGLVVVVGSGDMDLSSLMASYANASRSYEEYHDTFLDSPLMTLPGVNTFWSSEDGNSTGLAQTPVMPPEVLSMSRTLYYPENSYYTSVSFKQSIGSVRFGFTDAQLGKLRQQIRVAKLSRLQARYWDIPDWPINYRDYIWDALTREGVGMLSINEIDAASRRAWTPAYKATVSWIIGVSIYVVIVSMIAGIFVFYASKRRRCN